MRPGSTHGAPTHGAPTHGAPTHGASTHGASTHGAPTHGAPTRRGTRAWPGDARALTHPTVCLGLGIPLTAQFRQTNRTRLAGERTTNRQTNRTAFRNPSVQFRTSARLTDKQTEQHLGVPLCSSVYPSFTEPAPERVAPHLPRGATLPCSASAHACSVLAGFQRWSISRPITRPSPPPPTAAAASVGALSVSYVSGPAYTSLLAVTALHASRACRAQPRVRPCQSSPVSTRT